MKLRFSYKRLLRRSICVVLVITMATAPSAAVFGQANAAAQAVRQRVQGLGEAPAGELPPERPTQPLGPKGAGLGAPPATGGIDTAFVSPGAVAVVVLRPAQLMSSPYTEMLPREVATAASVKFLGFDPADVDEVVAFGEMGGPTGFSYGLTFKFNKPFNAAQIPVERRAHAQLSELNGKKYLQSQMPGMWSLYGPNNKTLVAAPDETLRQLVQAQGQSLSGPMLDRMRQAAAGSDLYVAVDMSAVRPMLAGIMPMIQGQVPPDAQPILQLPNLVSNLELTLNLTGDGPTALVAHANDEAAAEQVLTVMREMQEKQRQQLVAQMAGMANSEDPVDRALAAYSERVSASSAERFMPVREGASLTIFHVDRLDESQKKMLATGIGIAAGIALPAVAGARQAAMRNASTNGLKQIILGWHVFHDQKGAFPTHAIYSADGNPLLSWRVQILPYIDQLDLYQKFHLDEPWDSEHNKALIAEMPDVYANPSVPLEPGKTNYLAVVGGECLMDGTATGIAMKQVTDGTSNTIAVVEADPTQAVEWTKPDDLEFNAENPKEGVGNVRPGAWNAAFCDGSVQLIAEAIDPQMLKALFTRNGGEVVQRPDMVLPPQAPQPAGARYGP